MNLLCQLWSLNETIQVREGFRKKNRIFYGLLPNPPSDPGIKKITPIFLSEIRSQMGETNFTFGPIPKMYFFVL